MKKGRTTDEAFGSCLFSRLQLSRNIKVRLVLNSWPDRKLKEATLLQRHSSPSPTRHFLFILFLFFFHILNINHQDAVQGFPDRAPSGAWRSERRSAQRQRELLAFFQFLRKTY